MYSRPFDISDQEVSAGDLAGGILTGHVDEHLASIRATTGVS